MSSLDLFADVAPAAPVGLFEAPGPRWRTIAAHRPFLDDLASGLHAALSADSPEALAQAVVLTPSRRGARALAAAFVRAAGGRAMLLPQIRALGDLEEGEPPFEPGDLALDLPPAVTPLRRRFELAKLVVENERVLHRALDPAAALDLADALAGFLDSVQIEEVAEPERVATLVPGELARHWEISAEFLQVALTAWPARLAELGLVDVAARRTALLRALAERWTEAPPEHPLVAAGSTGAAPAIAALLAVVASAPKGVVVLPGLDQELADEAWAQIDDGPSGEAHPQGAMKRLLARAGVERGAVGHWPAAETAAEAARGRARRRVVNEALRPPEATADWLGLIAELKRQGGRDGVDPLAQGLDGLHVLAARNEEDAAAQAALLLRETLEVEGRTAALVTPDAALGRRVAARLARWGVTADASAGAELSHYPAGVLLALLARAAVDPLDPATLLAIAKHPLSRLGLGELELGRARRDLERFALRGPRPRAWSDLEARLNAPKLIETRMDVTDARALVAALRGALDHAGAPFPEGAGGASVPAAARALAEAAETVATGADGRLGPLWSGAGGEAAAGLVASVIDGAGSLPPATRQGFAQLVETLIAREVVRTGGNLHPRLSILGAIEARLVRADRLVLAGLEEGTWPRPAPTDPFLSRPMRSALGLPPPERRIGLAAHDFAQAACAPEVFLIHAERRDGQPAVKSRWLWRLETLARGAGLRLPSRPEVAAWARELDAPLDPCPPELRPAPRPAPTPPVAARPRGMGVTKVEEWVRDPYSTYARYVLHLDALEPPDAPVEARARGVAIHKAFERFAREHAEPDTATSLAFEALVLEELDRAGMPRARMARERALARRLSDWAAGFERERRDGASLLVENKGELRLEGGGGAGAFVLTATADRLERRTDRVDILDFKTGTPPSKPQVQAGFSPQLTLTAAVLEAGGFTGLGPQAPGEIAYVRVTGRREAGRLEVRGGAGGESSAMAAAALEGLRAHVLRFDEASTPYLSWAAPQFIGKRGGDYDHLSRLWEWHVMGEAESDA